MKNNTLKILLIFLTTGLINSCSTDENSLIDGLPDAVVNNDPAGSPPRGLDESWNGHSEVLYRQYMDNYVAVYYDDAVERPLEWPYEFLSDAWEYTTDVYGSYGEENILYAVFHAEPGEASYQTIFDEASSNRSLIDVPLDGREMSASNTDTALRQISGIVENSSNLVSGSPASALWRDQWSEIFIYDVYRGLGMEEEAQRAYDTFTQSTVDYPSPGINWFKDWYYPIYDEYGNVALANFFDLLAEYYPTESDAYTGDMTLGELIHFYSGATGEDLQPLAEEAFGWSEDRQTELLQARADFPLLDYPFDPIVVVTDLTFDAQVSVKYENPGGPGAGEGSLKVIDNNTNTKYLYFGYAGDMWIQQEFPEPKVVNRYTLTSGNDAPGRDPKSWTLQGSNDGVTWDLLDTRTNENFSSRNQTREFTANNEVAYKYYRLYITENGGDSLFQLSEWRLINWSSLLDPPAGGGGGEPTDPIDPTDPTDPVDVTEQAQATITVSRDNDGNPAENSSKLIDNDTSTKLFLPSFEANYWMQQELSQAEVVNKYTLTSGGDAADRDPKSWTLSGSNDGTTWEDLDTQTDETFETRTLTKEYSFNNEQAYQYYRLTIVANAGSGDFQLSEWRLIRE